MVVRCAVAVVALAGCRFGFDREDPGDASTAITVDAARDGIDLCAQSILCEDFTAMPSVPTNGNVQWFATGGRDGGALQLTGTTTTGAAAHWTLPTTTSGMLATRVYLRVHPSSPVQMFVVMLELNNAMATGGQEKISADLGAGDVFAIGAPYSGGGPASSLAITRDRWTCVELRVVVSSTAGEMHLVVDGSEVATRTMSDTLIPTGFQELILGVTLSNAEASTIIDYDDLVVARAPIGC